MEEFEIPLVEGVIRRVENGEDVPAFERIAAIREAIMVLPESTIRAHIIEDIARPVVSAGTRVVSAIVVDDGTFTPPPPPIPSAGILIGMGEMFPCIILNIGAPFFVPIDRHLACPRKAGRPMVCTQSIRIMVYERMHVRPP